MNEIVEGPLERFFERTFLDVLVLVEGFQGIVLGKSTERVDKVGAEIGVDVLRRELGGSRSVDRPVSVVAHDLLFSIACAIEPIP